jgi:glycosyltransferase involved in cell wall biosynthesis
MKLSVISPARNEEHTIKAIAKKVLNTLREVDFEWIIINDSSSDKTAEYLKELKKKSPKTITILTNPQQLGKSQSVKKGILISKGDYLVIQDTDLEYDPKDLLSMLKEIEKDKLDLIYGNRFSNNNKVIYFHNWLGNTLLSLLSSIFTGIRAGMFVRDIEVGYKMARGDLFRKVGKTITSKTNFGIEPELTAKFSRVKNIKFKQIPISYYPRTLLQGKKMKALKHGLEALREILYFNLRKNS